MSKVIMHAIMFMVATFAVHLGYLTGADPGTKNYIWMAIGYAGLLFTIHNYASFMASSKAVEIWQEATELLRSTERSLSRYFNDTEEQ